jgi:hypothetical protein
VSTLLDQLGGNVQIVAESLTRQGVTGTPRSVTDCPVARYLNAVIATEAHVCKVEVGDVNVVVSPDRWWSPSLTVTLPGPVQQFVRSFDSGQYKELVSRAGHPEAEERL